MSDFNQAVKRTLEFEGGFVDDPQDPGGATNFGITQRDVPTKDVRTLTEQDAREYYYEHYWKPLYTEIHSPEVGAKLFDMGVNLGVGTAVRILQETLGAPVDGSFGPNTLFATNEAGEMILTPYKAKLCEHYQELVVRNPNLAKFLTGWLRRANS